jgi:hypothetical protein
MRLSSAARAARSSGNAMSIAESPVNVPAINQKILLIQNPMDPSLAADTPHAQSKANVLCERSIKGV